MAQENEIDDQVERIADLKPVGESDEWGLFNSSSLVMRSFQEDEPTMKENKFETKRKDEVKKLTISKVRKFSMS